MSEVPVLLICSCSEKFGLGHIARMCVLQEAFKQETSYRPQLAILGSYTCSLKSKVSEILCVNDDPQKLFSELIKFIDRMKIRVVIFDLHAVHEGRVVEKFIGSLRNRRLKCIGVDCFINSSALMDFVWVPAIACATMSDVTSKRNGKVSFGWDHILLSDKKYHGIRSNGRRVIVLTGGGDVLGLGSWLPSVIDRQLKRGSVINWVKGPFALFPELPLNPSLNWEVHDNPSDIEGILNESDFALTLFGVSFFEALKYGLPSVVIPLKENQNVAEFQILKKQRVALCAQTPLDGVEILAMLMQDSNLADEISSNALKKLSVKGREEFVHKTIRLLEN